MSIFSYHSLSSIVLFPQVPSRKCVLGPNFILVIITFIKLLSLLFIRCATCAALIGESKFIFIHFYYFVI